MNKHTPTFNCWILTDGKAGTENQCLGLAEAIGVEPIIKRVQPKAPWTWLPVRYWPFPNLALRMDSDVLVPEWPQLLIASGRRSVPFSLDIKRKNGIGTFVVQVQNPRVPTKLFDMVVAPHHDHVKGPNVVETLGALNRVTPAKLDAAATMFSERFSHLSRPYVAVLLGGSSSSYQMTPNFSQTLGATLSAMAKTTGGSLLITSSRRTDDASFQALRKSLKNSACEVWDGSDPNPYFGLLSLADFIIVTSDSVSMTSDACTNGKPVYVVHLPGGTRKFREFHQQLCSGGFTRPFTGTLEYWSYEPLTDTSDAAGEILRCLNYKNFME